MPNSRHTATKFCGCPDDGHASCTQCEGWSQAEIDRFRNNKQRQVRKVWDDTTKREVPFSCDGDEAMFPTYLAKLLCDYQDSDTVHEAATQHWHEHEPRELTDACTQVTFTRTAHGLDCRVRQLNAETSELLFEENWRINVRPI